MAYETRFERRYTNGVAHLRPGEKPDRRGEIGRRDEKRVAPYVSDIMLTDESLQTVGATPQAESLRMSLMVSPVAELLQGSRTSSQTLAILEELRREYGAERLASN